jgi:uncharacterized protein (DUF58 family)
MRHDPDVQRAASSYRLGLPRFPVTGRTGELLGRGSGSSLEFQEYRPYQPGDDIRHLDWAAYARSDSLMVRLYREEISPRSEVVLDASRSMLTGGQFKSHLTRQLGALFCLLASQLGGQPSLILLGDNRPLEVLSMETLDRLTSVPFDGVAPFPHLLEENAVPLKKQAVRVVISDFLFEGDPEQLVRRLAGDASTLWLIQVLTEWESSPTPLGGRRLVDAESSAASDLLLDRKTVAAYKERLKRLQDEYARQCRRAHATWVSLIADRGLATLCHDDLCAAGILQPA